MRQFDHERFEVYRLAKRFVVMVHKLAVEVPRGNGHLVDQLQRAATSIPLNIAEGAGEYCQTEKSRFYRMARRSGAECAAILDICAELGVVSQGVHEEAREVLLSVVCMLVRLTKADRKPKTRQQAEGKRQKAKEPSELRSYG